MGLGQKLERAVHGMLNGQEMERGVHDDWPIDRERHRMVHDQGHALL